MKTSKKFKKRFLTEGYPDKAGKISENAPIHERVGRGSKVRRMDLSNRTPMRNFLSRLKEERGSLPSPVSLEVRQRAV
jgi:hypothetical protein